ncbi:hypothetical protein GCM10020370_61800 [Paenibacillus hodogayensis]
MVFRSWLFVVHARIIDYNKASAGFAEDCVLQRLEGLEVDAKKVELFILDHIADRYCCRHDYWRARQTDREGF